MQYFADQVISGIAVGAIYGLVAMGFALIYKSTGLLNFAQGEMAMMTAYFAWTISTLVPGNLWMVVGGALVCAALLVFSGASPEEHPCSSQPPSSPCRSGSRPP